MLLPTLHYFSTQSCKLRHMSYCGTCFCTPSSQKVIAKPFRKSYLSLISVIPHTLASQKFLEVEKHLIITRYKVGTVCSMLENFPLELFAHPLFYLFMHIWTTDTLPHIPFIHCTFTIYINNLPVNFCQMNIFSIQKLYRQLHFRGTGIFIFMPNL